jgi:hypothetical protein
MSSKRQQTLAKQTRERTVRERRERKQAKKREKRLAATERDQSVAVDDSALVEDTLSTRPADRGGLELHEQLASPDRS